MLYFYLLIILCKLKPCVSFSGEIFPCATKVSTKSRWPFEFMINRNLLNSILWFPLLLTLLIFGLSIWPSQLPTVDPAFGRVTRSHFEEGLTVYAPRSYRPQNVTTHLASYWSTAGWLEKSTQQNWHKKTQHSKICTRQDIKEKYWITKDLQGPMSENEDQSATSWNII